MTPYHAKYFAHQLTRQAQPGGVDRLSMALFDACVDLNPHQIEAGACALPGHPAATLGSGASGKGQSAQCDPGCEDLPRRSDMEVGLIEEEFGRLMFDVEDV